MPQQTPETIRQFALEWVEAWNSHDLESILTHYADDFEFTSPYIADIAKETSGTLRGKPAIRTYWTKALERIPQLRFELIDILFGVDCATIYYKGHRGTVAETFFFDSDNGKVIKACASYSIQP